MKLFQKRLPEAFWGVTRGQRGTISWAPNHYEGAESCGGRRMTAGAPKSPNNVTSTFFNIVHLLPKVLRFEHWGAALAFWPGRHLTFSRPWKQLLYFEILLEKSFGKLFVKSYWAIQRLSSLSNKFYDRNQMMQADVISNIARIDWPDWLVPY